MGKRKKKIDRKSERIVKKRGKADIIKSSPQANTIKIRTEDKHGNKSARTYSMSTKHGLSPKRSDKPKTSKKSKPKRRQKKKK